MNGFMLQHTMYSCFLVLARLMQRIQNVFPGHVKTEAGSFDRSTMLLSAHFFRQQMSPVALNVEYQHGRPTGTYYRGLYPSDLVFCDDIGGVAPKIVVAQTHRDAFRSAGLK